MMGAADLWVIVEGRDHDRPHYERLLESLAATRGQVVSVRLAEQIELDGVTAGGKTHALALHAYYESTGELKQRNREGTPRMVFMLDRDRDDLRGLLRSSVHVMYTEATDVEADILANTDIWRAMRSAYGIGRESCEIIERAVGHPQPALMRVWDDWIRLGLLAALASDAPSPRFAQPSTVNSPQFGAPDEQSVSELRSSVEAMFLDAEAIADAQRVADQYLDTRGALLLKGRWTSRYVHFLVRTHLANEIVRANVQADSIIDTGLEVLDYTGQWTRHYEAEFTALLAA
jgi:hypothetical protein